MNSRRFSRSKHLRTRQRARVKKERNKDLTFHLSAPRHPATFSHRTPNYIQPSTFKAAERLSKRTSVPAEPDTTTTSRLVITQRSQPLTTKRPGTPIIRLSWTKMLWSAVCSPVVPRRSSFTADVERTSQQTKTLSGNRWYRCYVCCGIYSGSRAPDCQDLQRGRTAYSEVLGCCRCVLCGGGQPSHSCSDCWCLKIHTLSVLFPLLMTQVGSNPEVLGEAIVSCVAVLLLTPRGLHIT